MKINIPVLVFVVLLILKLANIGSVSWSAVFVAPVLIWLFFIIAGGIITGMVAAYSAHKWNKYREAMSKGKKM